MTTNKQHTLVEHLAQLAKEVASTDHPIHGINNFDTDSAYNLVASAVLEMYLSASKETREEVLLASLIHSQVENMILNIQLMESKQ